LTIEVDQWLDMNDNEDIRVYFGGVDVMTKICNLRKDYVNDTTSFDLYGYGDSNFDKIDEFEYKLLKFEYQEKPFYYTYFNVNQSPNGVVNEMAKAFNRFQNIFIEATASDNNLIISSIYNDDSWNNMYLSYYLGPNSNVSDFQVNGIDLSGVEILDGHYTVLSTMKRNNINFTPYISSDKIIYSVDNEAKDNLNMNSLIQTKLGRSKAIYTLVDGILALPKDPNNLDLDIITIENDNDDCKQNHSNYIGITEKFIPNIYKIIQI
jgi:hypothetical protein